MLLDTKHKNKHTDVGPFVKDNTVEANGKQDGIADVITRSSGSQL